MLRSLFTAVTGVRAHQTMLDVTGNNISNANTTGFKKDTTIFADLMYQANKYASGAGDSRGGINPAQVGLGVSVSAIETVHTQGSGQYTGNPLDMMIQDKGFFVYQDGNQQIYSRSGALVLDGNSDAVLSGTGYRLQGYQIEETPLDGYQQAAELSTVNIPLGQKIDAKATTQVDYQCNLDSRSSAYLPYGYADKPFNTTAGHDSSVSGYSVINMGGTSYDLAFTTELSENVSNDVDGSMNYLSIQVGNGGDYTTLTFSMTGIDRDTGLPELALPRIVLGDDGAQTTATGAADSTVHFEGWLTGDNQFIDSANLTIPDGATQDIVDTYLPVYRFPGQTPPQYFAAQYDDNSGTLKIRSLSLMQDGVTDPISATNAGLYADQTAGVFDSIKINPTVFTYNIKDDMNYTSFQLSGSPTVYYDDANGDHVAEAAAHKVTYDFIAEFDESITVGSSDPSSLAKTSSKLTLWYYGYSNGDVPAGTGFTDNAVERMHKLEATVYFNTDGTFESIEWDSDDSEAPQGYHIKAGGQSMRMVDGAITTVTVDTPNFQIMPGSSSNATTSKDTLNFKQAQNLDQPGDVSSEGLWNTVGTTYQGGYHATKTTIYDDNGKEHTLEVTFKKITENRWRWEAFLVERDEKSGEDLLANIMPTPSSGEIEFDGSGRISNAVASSNDNPRRGDGNDRYPNAEVEISIPFSLNGQPNSVITLNFGGGVGAGGENIDGVTQFASETTTKPVYQDGYTMGVLKNYSIAVDGTITGSYDNGLNIPLYRVALATFANEQGLEKIGNTMFRATVNSGNANIDGATTNGKGSIMAQYLEMSNVDLTEEFTHLIIAQRGFQANTRVVTVSDQILEEVVNLKR